MNWERHAASIELCLSISRVEVNSKEVKNDDNKEEK